MKMLLSQALQKMLLHIEPTKQYEKVPLLKARGRVSVKGICAKYNIPPYDISLRDGVVIYEDFSQDEGVEVNSLQSISTGSRVDARVKYIVEFENIKSDVLSCKDIKRFEKKQSFIKPQGEDIKKGQLLLDAGKMINSFDIANLASQGINEVLVYKKIQIACIGVGKDLLDINKSLHVEEIYNSNAYAIATRAKVLGAKIKLVTNVKDKSELKQAIVCAKDCDIIVTIGGMSRGDVVDDLLDDDEFGVVFKGVALSPAGLSAFSFLAQKPLLHLPGLPLSALLGFEILGAEAISRLYAQDFAKRSRADAICTKNIKQQKTSQSIVPGFFDGSHFNPIEAKAGMMNVLNHCNGYILTSIDELIQKGDKVVFYPFLAWGV